MQVALDGDDLPAPVGGRPPRRPGRGRPRSRRPGRAGARASRCSARRGRSGRTTAPTVGRPERGASATARRALSDDARRDISLTITNTRDRFEEDHHHGEHQQSVGPASRRLTTTRRSRTARRGLELGGPPPWVQGLIDMAQTGGQPDFGRGHFGGGHRGPKVRRGDVRSAILDVLAVEPMNGYQIIQQIAERSGGAWKPSPGSVYPTVQQLEDEGLVEGTEGAGRRLLQLTEEGRTLRRGAPRRDRRHLAALRPGRARRGPRRPQAGHRPGHGRGLAGRRLRHQAAAGRGGGDPRRHPTQALRHPGRRGDEGRRAECHEQHGGARAPGSATPSARPRSRRSASTTPPAGSPRRSSTSAPTRPGRRAPQPALWPLFADLPRPASARPGAAPARRPAPAARRGQPGWWLGPVLAPLLAVIAVLVVLTHLPVILLVARGLADRGRGGRHWAHSRGHSDWSRGRPAPGPSAGIAAAAGQMSGSVLAVRGSCSYPRRTAFASSSTG